MAGIFGVLNLNDSDYLYNATQGQQAIYDVAKSYIDAVNAEMARAMSIFVAAETEKHTERYKLPGGGRLQSLGQNPQGVADAVKAGGAWDVAYPLEEYGAQIAGTRVSMAYMTVADMDKHVATVVAQNVNTVRFEMLKKLFKNTNTTFTDMIHGSLTVVPLANGDSVVYPPAIGSESEAIDNHYLESGYLAAAIDDTNNPYVTIEAKLSSEFGQSQGNENVVVFINSAQRGVTVDLLDFVEENERFVIPGTQTARLTGQPTGHPGRLIGRVSGCWVVVWDWIPANYMLGVHLDTEAPLKMRRDPAAVGLGSGLQIVARDEQYPFEAAHWSHRFGFGVGNRLGAVVMELGTGGTYTIPTAYQ